MENLNSENIIQVISGKKLAKLPPDGGSDYNRLVFEKSPYLLQHAKNPVDWYAWEEEAFRRAEMEDKPIFLSIGYATCHWCHVMAHESFEDVEVARLLNEAFVCIKVDREERPDIDQIYMSVCQVMTQRGGWPLTIIMAPNKSPFFAATYIPKFGRYHMIGMMDLIPRISELWKGEREKLLENGDHIVSFLKQASLEVSGEDLDESVLDRAYEELKVRFDEVHGGFGSAPKFPTPHNLVFLLRYYQRSNEHFALEMVERTLQEMRLGGMFDHVGFGFHRYSTDSKWFLPHFEKMLYDQALLAQAYVTAFQITEKKEYRQTANEIFTYVLRDMVSPEGGFYSAEDADSEGEEGLFYLWRPEEFEEILGEDAELFCKLFDVESGGNYAEEASGKGTGLSILHLRKSFAEWTKECEISECELKESWEKARQKLFAFRKKRIHPLKDDKILTDWNGLMIAALAKASYVLENPLYLEKAEKAADFIWERLRDEKGDLLKRYRLGESGLSAHLDDYAFLTWGFLELYEASFEIKHLERALEVNEKMLNKFWDQENGGFFFSADSPDLLVRNKQIYDGGDSFG